MREIRLNGQGLTALPRDVFEHADTLELLDVSGNALTALPPGSNPRTRALAAELRADPALAQADTPALVQAVLERLRSGGYTYTLEPGLYGEHTRTKAGQSPPASLTTRPVFNWPHSCLMLRSAAAVHLACLTGCSSPDRTRNTL